jgi:hypothetical protein
MDRIEPRGVASGTLIQRMAEATTVNAIKLRRAMPQIAKTCRTHQ